MRRLTAHLLLFLFSFVLTAPVLLARDADSQLPECCRRAGRHHCSMGRSMGRSMGQRSGSGLNAVCPLYPHAGMSAANPTTPDLKPSAALFAASVSHSSASAQTRALWRLSHSRSGQKRGPPSFLS